MDQQLDNTVDISELLAIIGEQQVIARKREQKISELESQIAAMREAQTAAKSAIVPHEFTKGLIKTREEING
jgi:hypothetical protein